ncbi:MAG: hypothetical protein ACYTHK_19040 [Planctomycetota bacterium]|jgi:hypothetical protein
MHRSGICLLFCAALASADDLPHARDVVVRRSPSLEHAIRVAAAPSRRHGLAPGEVAIIVDVTPYTAKSEQSLVRAILKLPGRSAPIRAWRIAPLGGSLRHAYRSPSDAARELPRILSKPTPSRNTMRDLASTVASFGSRGGRIVYLADWHFEDDDGVERFVRLLRRRGHVFSVVGSEAAFSRGWNDGFFPSRRQQALQSGDRRYDVRIGRDPFGPRDRDAPWHGGDTAFPHLPSYFGGAPWHGEFATRREPDGPVLEDLRERLRETRKRSTGEGGAYPLPSSFGPYGLMRAAAMTGGRYVLWSFNRSGRSNVEYDYGRCNRFAPDLRARRAILADYARRPLARALLDAWHVVSGRRVGLARVTPPIDSDSLAPRPMKLTEGRCPGCFAFQSRSELQALLQSMPRVLEGIDRGIRILDRAIGRNPGRRDAVDARLFADAQLLRHILAVQRFSLGEVYEIAGRIRDDAWDKPDRTPCIFREDFLLPGADPAHVAPRTRHVFDLERGEALAAERRLLLQRYAGTPFGETVARNAVCAYRFGWGEKRPAGGGKGMRTPAQSAETPGPTTVPGGGSGSAPGTSSGG